MSDFVALDVETANVRRASICQIGCVDFSSDSKASDWVSLVNPLDEFDPFNVDIHGIDASVVQGAPCFADLLSTLSEKLEGRVVVHHGAFDRTAFEQAYTLFDLPPIQCAWVDNTKVVRRVWEQFRTSGYNLKNLAKHFGVNLEHHDALSDAKAAGEVFRHALGETNTTPEYWIDAQTSRLDGSGTSSDVTRSGEADGPHSGDFIVFTGALQIQRRMAADIAAQLGFDVKGSVTKATTHICVGIPDKNRQAGYEKSSKHRRAEDLARNGQELVFLSESDFWALAKSHGLEPQ